MSVLKSDLVSRSARKSSCKNFNYNFLQTFVSTHPEALAACNLWQSFKLPNIPYFKQHRLRFSTSRGHFQTGDWVLSCKLKAKPTIGLRGRSDAKHLTAQHRSYTCRFHCNCKKVRITHQPDFTQPQSQPGVATKLCFCKKKRSILQQ